MKKLGFIFSAVAAVSMLGACGGGAAEAGEAGEASKAGEGAVTYAVDAAKSTVEWKGSAIFGLKSHNGTIGIKDGELQTEAGKLKAGKVNIDMNAIKVADLPADKGGNDLTKHLTGKDFFDAEKFATSTFEITAIEEKAEGENTHAITGNLTMRGVTKSITFPAKVSTNGNDLTASGKVTINRLDWGMDYGSDKENTSKEVAEKIFKETQKAAIDKNIELTLNVTATKK